MPSTSGPGGQTGNISALSSDNTAKICLVIEYLALLAHCRDMKTRLFSILGLVFALAAASPAAASCFADYKAKQTNPLRLHYGVIELPDSACANRNSAAQEIERRIGKSGWQLLNVMSIFQKDGLAERKESAGAFFLVF